MNELKFRVWDKIKKQMLKPQAISFDIQSSDLFAINLPRRSWEPVSKFELLQWTGLIDQNGADVYEGDIIRISSILVKVIWNQSTASFELINLSNSERHTMSELISGSVIGNTYENPNLMLAASTIA